MDDLSRNLARILGQISQSCEKYHRPTDSVRLVAVGKKHPVSRIAVLAAAGQRDFGENYLQEAQHKMSVLADDAAVASMNLVWHFIGHIQSRKCAEIANRFDWVHTVDSLKVANRLDRFRTGEPLNVLIQVNIDEESSKAGVSPGELQNLAKAVAELPNLNLRGLMVIPRPETEFARQRATFARCREMFEEMIAGGLNMDQLSMGMTADMEAAIAEGATMVRIGTALFGARPSDQLGTR